MSEKPFAIIVLILMLIAVIFYLRSESGLQALRSAPPGTSTADYGPAPDISMPIGLNGKRIDLSSLHGHVVILDFWATWCVPCKMSIPALERIYEKHKSDGLQVVGVSVDDPAKRRDVDSTVKSLGMTYPIAMINDIPDAQTKYPFASIPFMIMIDKKGIVRAQVSGYEPNGNNEDLVVKLLNEK